MNSLTFILTFAVALIIAFIGTPITRRVALRYNMLDMPDGRLKKHTEPVPYMGGVIVYFALICAIALFSPFTRELLGILFASSILLVVGLFDDLKALTPGIKFLFQIVATFILIKSGIRIYLIFLPTWLNLALTFLIILTCINAYNLIDIMDGLATSIGLLATLTLFVVSIYGENPILSILSLAFAGSLLGFLRFNWEPARIYLGDAGSMVLGLIIGALTTMIGYTENNPLGFFSAFLVLGIPLFDLSYVVILRLRKKRSPFRGSPDHIALRLRKKFQTSSQATVSMLILLQFSFAIIVLINFFATPSFTLYSTGVLILVLIALGFYLGRVKME